jgi:hypothetical protein
MPARLSVSTSAKRRRTSRLRSFPAYAGDDGGGQAKSLLLDGRLKAPMPPALRSFLLLFFKKEALLFKPLS